MANSPSLPQSSRAWRWTALAVWALIALAYLAFFLADLRRDYVQLQMPCQGTDCNWAAISAAEREVLRGWGLAMQAYAAFVTGALALTVAVYWFLGGLLLWRLGTTRIGWTVSLALVVIPIGLIADSANVYADTPGLLIPAAILSAVGITVMVLFIYLFPDGRLYPPQAGLWLGAAIAMSALSTALEIVGFEFNSRIRLTLMLATVAVVLMGGVFQIARYRRKATLVERQQTKWALLGLIAMIGSVPVWLLIFGGGLSLAPGAPRLWGSLAGLVIINLLLMGLPVTISIAILRYRLFDVDVLIRRAALYGALTVTLAAVYFGATVVLQQLFSLVTGSARSPAAIVASTLGIAVLFNPLRRRIQHDLDRRFFRQKYDAAQALERFGRSVRDEVELEQVSQHLLRVVQETMQPESARLWLRPARLGAPEDSIAPS